MNLFRRTIPLALAFVSGLLGFALMYIPHGGAQWLFNELAKWDRIIAAFALFLGIYSLLGLHWRKLERRQEGWGYSALVWTAFLVMLGAGIYNNGEGPLTGQATAAAGEFTPVNWLFQFVLQPAGATMFSILAFYMASAAYRTFRARTVPAALLLTAAVIVMLGRVPIGALLGDWLPDLTQWLMEVPNAAVKRAIFVGTGLGIVATSLRIIFGVERAYLGGD